MAYSLKVEKCLEEEEKSLEEKWLEKDDDTKYGPPDVRNFHQKYERDYKDLPKLKDEKPLIGPMTSTGNIKILYPAQIDGYDVDHNELATMDLLGLPTGFDYGHMRPNESTQKQSRGAKKRFYCQTCMIDLNSEDTMASHLL